MSARILVVGEAPGARGNVVAFATGGRGSGDRLRAHAGWSDEFWSTCVDAVNLLTIYPGRDGNGARFDLAAAWRAARRVSVERYPVVLLCGRRVGAAFGVQGGAYFDAHVLATGGLAWLVPHPSGVNRWWNDERHRAIARAFFASLELEVA